MGRHRNKGRRKALKKKLRREERRLRARQQRQDQQRAAPPTDHPGNDEAERRRLQGELRRQLLKALQTEYQSANYAYFGGGLIPPVLSLSDSRAELGKWWRRTRRIELSEPLILEHPWPRVVAVLKHEMAHQYVDEVLGGEPTPHGPKFRDICRRIGISPRATASWEQARDLELQEAQLPERERSVLQKIANLLSLAESRNENEARAAMRAAQRLMYKYNVENVDTTVVDDDTFGVTTVGKVSGRRQEWERLLAAILAKHFFVECISVPVYVPEEGKWKRVLEISGRRSNLEMAVHVYDFLAAAAQRAWEEHKKERGIRSDRDRRTYLAGVMTGFLEKLDEQHRGFQEQGLVWQGDAGLDQFVRRRHPRIRTTRFAAGRDTEARREGERAGKRIVLHRPVKAASRGDGHAGLLGSG